MNDIEWEVGWAEQELVQGDHAKDMLHWGSRWSSPLVTPMARGSPLTPMKIQLGDNGVGCRGSCTAYIGQQCSFSRTLGLGEGDREKRGKI